MEQIETIRLFLLFFIFHGFFLSFLMALGHLIVSRKTMNNFLFMGVFLAIAFLEIHFLFYETGLLSNNSWVQALNIPAFFALGPMLYFLFRSLGDKHFKIKKTQMIHLLPAGAALIGNGIAVFAFPAESGRILPGYFHNSISLWIGFGGFIITAAYITWSWGFIIRNRLWQRSFLKQEPAGAGMLAFIGLLTLGFIVDAAAAALNSIIIFEAAVFLLSLTVVLLFLVHFRHPKFYHVFQNKVEKERQKRSQLKGLNLKNLELKLKSLMTEEELFLQSGLSLSDLAGRLGLTAHQLSEFINRRFRVNFPSYVNQYRIEKAKQLLLENPGSTILAIAYDAGFESKSTFNDAFQKSIGTTPSQFRRSNSQNPPVE